MPVISGGGSGGGAATTVRYSNDYLAALGLVSEAFPRLLTTQVAAPASGELRVTAVPLHAGDAVSNVVLWINAAPTTLTLARAAIYSPAALALAASSTNQSGLAWATGTWQAVPLSAPYNVPTTDLYYVGVLFVAAAAPQLAGAGNATGSDSFSPPNSNRELCFRQTGLADLPNPMVAASGNFAHYIAVY